MEENKNSINDNEIESINLIKKENPIEEKKIEEVKPVTPISEPLPNPEGKKKGSVVVVILTVVILLLVIGLIYMLVFYKDKDDGKDNNDNSKPTPTPSVTPTPTPSVTPTPIPQEENDTDKKYELTVYKSTDENSLTIENEYNKDEIEPAFKINVSTNNAKVLAVDDYTNTFVLYKDDGVYLYNEKTKKSEKVNLESNYKDYNIYLNDNDSKIIGIAYLKNDNTVGYYNVLKNIKLYDGKYKAYEFGDDDYSIGYTFTQVNDKYIMMRIHKGTYLLSCENEKIQLSYKYDEEPGGTYAYRSYKSGNDYIYVFMGCITEYCGITNVYNDKFEEIYSGEVSDDIFSFYNKTIYLVEKNNTNSSIVKKLDINGKELLSINNNYEVLKIYNNYLVNKKDNTIGIDNIDDNSENKEIVKLEKDWNYNEYESGYYTKNDLDYLNEKNKKEGLYIVIEYPDKDSKGNYGMEYCYTTDHQIIEYPIKQMIGGRAKPVLYLYPEEETSVNVKFAHPEYLTTTYPKYNGSWEVTAKPNGDLTDKDGKYYYALYWDEVRYSETDFSEGFYVDGKDAINFLEEKLTIIGLNAKERNEFIMYWLPIMENNKKNLVYFELTNEREVGNKLIINPKPDSLLRVSIHIKKVNEKVKIKEQKLTTFKRVGFTAVEWGGMTY